MSAPPSGPPGGPQYLRPHARVPAGVVTGPQLQVSGGDQRTQDVVLVVHVEGVGEVIGLAAGGGGGGSQNRHSSLSLSLSPSLPPLPVDVGPQRHGGGLHLLLRPLLLAAVQEGAEQAAVQVVQHGDQQQLVELKGCWEL